MLKKYSFTLLLTIGGFSSICHAVEVGELILNLLQAPHTTTTKQQVLDLISPLVPGSPEAQNVLKYQPPRVKSVIGWSSYSTCSLLENIVCKLPEELVGRREKGEVALSNNDLLEIGQKLWALDPATASSLAGSVEGSSDDSNLDGAPLIHKLIGRLFSAQQQSYHGMGISPTEETKQEIAFFKSYVDFIIKEYPQTLLVKNHLGNTCLHYIQAFVTTKHNYNERPLAQELMEKFLTVKELINLQNNEGSTALHLAVKTYLPHADILIKKGANPSTPNNKGKNAIDLIVENIEANVAAAYQNAFLLCTLLKSEDNSPDANGGIAQYLASLNTRNNWSILHIFAKQRLEEGFTLLQQKGINLQAPELNQKDITGKTPFDYMQGSPESFKHMLTLAPTLKQQKQKLNLSERNNTYSIIGYLGICAILGLTTWYLAKHYFKKDDPEQTTSFEELSHLEGLPYLEPNGYKELLTREKDYEELQVPFP